MPYWVCTYPPASTQCSKVSQESLSNGRRSTKPQDPQYLVLRHVIWAVSLVFRYDARVWKSSLRYWRILPEQVSVPMQIIAGCLSASADGAWRFYLGLAKLPPLNWRQLSSRSSNQSMKLNPTLRSRWHPWLLFPMHWFNRYVLVWSIRSCALIYEYRHGDFVTSDVFLPRLKPRICAEEVDVICRTHPKIGRPWVARNHSLHCGRNRWNSQWMPNISMVSPFNFGWCLPMFLHVLSMIP